MEFDQVWNWLISQGEISLMTISRKRFVARTDRDFVRFQLDAEDKWWPFPRELIEHYWGQMPPSGNLDSIDFEHAPGRRSKISRGRYAKKLFEHILARKDEIFARHESKPDVAAGSATNNQESGSPRGKNKKPRQPNLLVRQEVESKAITIVKAHFDQLKYQVQSVEADNVGWDLEARQKSEFLRIEVKGLSGSTISVELTPNEYAKMRQFRDSYRLCVVTNALASPKLDVFAFSETNKRWESDDRQILSIEKIVAARCSAS